MAIPGDLQGVTFVSCVKHDGHRPDQFQRNLPLPHLCVCTAGDRDAADRKILCGPFFRTFDAKRHLVSDVAALGMTRNEKALDAKGQISIR